MRKRRGASDGLAFESREEEWFEEEDCFSVPYLPGGPAVIRDSLGS